jgi:predicted Ser/Thr protein kinase
MLRLLGKGSRSIVFAASNQSTCREVCVKFEPYTDCEQIENEFKILSHLKGCKGIPQVLFYGTATFQGRKSRALVTGS